MPERVAAPSERTAPMRLFMILDGFVPEVRNIPCKIAIFTNGHKIKVFDKIYIRSLALDPLYPLTWERNYCLERYQTPQALETYLRENGLLKENGHE